MILLNGILFEELSITQENNQTLIAVDNEILAILQDVDIGMINSEDFITV